jgi:hypothetical protein
VASEIYQSAWTDVPVRIQKCLWIVMMRAQIPLEIKASVAKYNLETFAVTLDAAYGYVTYLQSMRYP